MIGLPTPTEPLPVPATAPGDVGCVDGQLVLREDVSHHPILAIQHTVGGRDHPVGERNVIKVMPFDALAGSIVVEKADLAAFRRIEGLASFAHAERQPTTVIRRQRNTGPRRIARQLGDLVAGDLLYQLGVRQAQSGRDAHKSKTGTKTSSRNARRFMVSYSSGDPSPFDFSMDRMVPVWSIAAEKSTASPVCQVGQPC